MDNQNIQKSIRGSLSVSFYFELFLQRNILEYM